MVKKNEVISIAVTGPESSGKSFTSEALAEYFDGWVVPEFARQYLVQIDREYTYEDVLTIARAQADIEQKVLADADRDEVKIVFFDSELINTRIWLEEKFDTCADFVKEAIQHSPHDHYLLMKPDLEWEPDPLRENPYDRDRLFDLHVKYFREYNKSYTVIEGDMNTRIELAKRVARTFFMK